MAGRRTSIASRAAAALVAGGILVSPGSAGAAPADGPVVVSKDEEGVSAIFGRVDEDRLQKLAQVFVAPPAAKKLASLTLPLAADGEAKAVVKIYRVGKKPPFGTLLRKTTVSVDGSQRPRWRLRPAVKVDPGERYSFVLKVADSQRVIGTSGGFGYKPGQRWCFCPYWDGKKIHFDDVRWQSAKSLESYMNDLAFELRFWRG